MGIIKAKQLVHEYIRRDEEGNVESIQTALDHIDLDVQPGQFIAILGHNGSGKSTLAKHINALLAPTEGSLWVDGKDVTQEENILPVRKTAGMVFQNPDNQIIASVVEEDVGFGPENIGVPTDEIWQRVEESLKSVGMLQYRHHSPNKLSGGQKQRVAIAGVMAMEPKCIVEGAMSLILDKINYVYSEGTAYQIQALKDVNLEIRDGQFIGVIGHTGSGKSTLIQHLNGLVKATSGTIYFNGQDIYDEDFDLRELRNRVGLVFQYPEHQLFETTIFDDVCFGPKNQGLSKEEAGLRAFEALRSVGLPEELYYQSPFDLSGGQKRRVAIAGVLAMKPEVLILDEPTAGLDPAGRDEILDLIARMHKEKGITVILVSHSMEDVAKYVERIIVMNHGQVMFDNTPCEVFKHYKELEQIGLAAPQVTYLMHELKEKGLNVNTEATTVAEARESLLEVLLGREPNHRGSNLEEENLC